MKVAWALDRPASRHMVSAVQISAGIRSSWRVSRRGPVAGVRAPRFAIWDNNRPRPAPTHRPSYGQRHTRPGYAS
jgi:hypothetical protein